MTIQQPQHNDSPSDGVTIAVSALLGVVFAIGLAAWLGAQLAVIITGDRLAETPPNIAEILWNTVSEYRADPAQAWPEPHRSQLPGPWIYWTATAAVGVALGALLALAYRALRPHREGVDTVQRAGTNHEAQFAGRSDIRPLRIAEPTPGRYLLGRVGRRLLATEARNAKTRSKRRSIAGPVAHIGPSQCGKTTDAITALKSWVGPAIVVSPKSDVALHSLDARRRLGEVRVFSPSGHMPPGVVAATWNPLDLCRSWEEAQHIAQRLIDATEQDSTSSGKFWAGNGVSVLAAFMLVARHSDKTMADVARWVIAMDQPTDDGPGEVATYIKALAVNDSIDEMLATQVSTTMRGVWASDSRMKSSYFVTVQSAVRPWTRASVQEATSTTNVNLAWLRESNNTLFITAPLVDQRALAPVIGAFIATIVDEATTAAMTTIPDEQAETLVLLDEAANLQLPQLPEWSSVLAGLGLQLVTVWQDISQLRGNYKDAAMTIIGNCRSLIFYGGTTDPATFDLINAIVGKDFHESRLDRLDYDGTASVQELPLIPPNVLRMMPSDRRLLIQSNIAPIQVTNIDKVPRQWR